MAKEPSKEQLIEEAEAIIESHFKRLPHMGEPSDGELKRFFKEGDKQLKKERKKYKEAIEWLRKQTKKRFDKGEE